MQIGPRRLILPLALVMFLAATPAFAQAPNANEDEGIGIGAEIGFVRNNLSSSSVTANFHGKTGLMLGLWIGGNKNGRVGFTGEFVYLQKNSEANGVTFKQKALEIPAVFHINFGSKSRARAGGYVVIGPVFTINVKSDLSNGVTGNNFSSADVGILGGAGFEAFRLGFEVRGNWGMKSVTDSGGGQFVDAKTRSVEILAKIRFN